MLRLFAILWLFLPLLLVSSQGLAAGATEPVISVAKLQGKGLVRIRRASGVEVTAAAGDKLSAGDKIFTDADSTADLILHDGSLVRVGLNTDYKIEAIQEEKKGLWAWTFEMAKDKASGSIRALVEKSQERGFIKFKVHTPSGTMGVRGTEIILTEDNGTLELVTLHGEALLGPPNADFKNLSLFESVREGKSSKIKSTQKRATPAAPFEVKDLFSHMGETQGIQAKEVLLGIDKKDGGSFSQSKSNPETKAILEKAKMEFERVKNSMDKTYAPDSVVSNSQQNNSNSMSDNSPSVASPNITAPSTEPSSMTPSSSNIKSSSTQIAPIQAAPITPKKNSNSTVNSTTTQASEKTTTANTKTTASSSLSTSTKTTAQMEKQALVQKQVEEMNKLYEATNKSLISQAQQPLPPPSAEAAPDTVRASVTRGGGQAASSDEAAKAAAPAAELCKSQKYQWGKDVCSKRSWFGTCTRYFYKCWALNVFDISCPTGTSKGTVIKDEAICRAGAVEERND